MNRLRSSVRPLVTFAFVIGQLGLAAAWAYGAEAAEQAFAALGTFTILIVKDYFDDRKKAEN